MSEDRLCIRSCDPSGSRAIAFLFKRYPRTISAEDTPTLAGELDAATLADRIGTMRLDLLIIERVGAMPKQGVSSTFKFGKAYGIDISVVAALKIPVRFVAPSVWKRHFGLPSDKEEARARALQLLPEREQLFSRKRDLRRPPRERSPKPAPDRREASASESRERAPFDDAIPWGPPDR